MTDIAQMAKDARHRVQIISTPTGPLSILRDIAVRLLQEGVISGDLDGALHANDAATVKAATVLHGVCDFCSAPGIEHGFDVPDFDMIPGTDGGLSRSTNGWAACGTCGELVKANRRKDLFERALASLSFAKFTKPAIQELHNRFWQAMEAMSEARGMALSLADFVNDTLPDPPQWAMAADWDRAERVRVLSKITGLTTTEIEQAISGAMTPPVAVKMLDWSKTYGAKKYGRNEALTATTLMMMIGGPRPPLSPIVPHWQRALDAKLEVLHMLGSLLKNPSRAEAFPEAVDLNDKAALARITAAAKARSSFRDLGFEQDYRLLPSSVVYSFNGETEAAIIEASESIPHNAPLSSIETPTGCGWFWFDQPLDVAASPAASEHTHALLWAWINAVGEPGGEIAVEMKGQRTMPSLLFSAYVIDEKGGMGQGRLFPSTRWYWPLHMSFHDMLAFNGASWTKTYGPGTPMHGDPNIIGQQDTLKVIADLSLFFMQSCLWFRQTVPGTQKKLDPILTKTPGHIERHARKRAQKELRSDAPPVVHVVALRKTARTEVSESHSPTPGERNYHCRWIVKGHSRLQACGPGRKDRKLIWIDSYPKGPDGMPLRTKTTVYAVVR